MEKLFSFEFLHNHLALLKKEALRPIENLDPHRLENIGIDEYYDIQYKNNMLAMPTLHIEEKTRSSKQVKDDSVSMLDGLKYKYQITIHIPVSGQISKVAHKNILKFKPINHFQEVNAYLIDNEVQIKLDVSESGTEQELIIAINDNIKLLVQTYGMLKSEVEAHNTNLKSIIRDKLQQVNRRYSKARKKVNSLKIPLKRNQQSSIIIKPKFKKKISINQVNLEKKNEIEPYISLDTYNEILSLINDCLKNIERMPSLFKDRKENDLRDLILFVLDPNFEMGSVTGETFNKGKTDILLRYNSTNVFIAECKFWKGSKCITDTINQLLSYLTWRDSKSAIIFFVKEQDISSIIVKIKENIKNHDNYVKLENEISEGVFQYKFYLTKDSFTEIWLTIMMCHVYSNKID